MRSDLRFDLVRDFYRQNPFPDFVSHKYCLQHDLYRHANAYTLLLDNHLPLDSRIIELGCGTGQLSCLLSLRGRRVTGVDFSEVSLAKANALKARLNLKTVDFRLQDITNIVRDDAYERIDAVICNGVFPCLPSSEDVFSRICQKMVRPGTLIILGLYHRWGRMMFRVLRRILPKKSIEACIESMIVKVDEDQLKLESWMKDQGSPVIEVYHTAVQVLSWFNNNDVQWLRSLPGVPGDRSGGTDLFQRPTHTPRPGLHWSLRELFWAFTLWKTGGYFVVMGQGKT
jgi:SAM-dependent methyltransferase